MQSAKFSILIVDDNHVNLRLLSATFEDHGFFVYTAASAADAQKLLDVHADIIELVLSDIQMPLLSGLDLLKWMKTERSPINEIPVLLITSQLPDSCDRVLGLSLGAVDYLTRSLDAEEIVIRVTHAIESYSQIKNLRRSLETTESLASTGRLFAASNHEIKNVAQIICIATGILQRDFQENEVLLSETAKKALSMLRQSIDLLSGMTKMIGGIVGSVDVPTGPVELSKIVDDVILMVAPLFKRNIRISFAPIMVTVLGSKTFLTQILLNLLLNARDAIEELGSESSGASEIKVEILNDDTMAVLVVTDCGVGLPMRETRTVFHPFASTKQLRGGTGLGLWLSSHLSEKMGGELTLSSEGPHCGAVAKIMLKKVNI